MRVLLILPDARMHKLRLGTHVVSMREAPLTMATLAGLAGDEADISWTCVDESIEKVPLDGDADLVGISVLTGTAPRAYDLADHFRGRGIPVILGGVHVTLLPDEAAAHADAIVTGMADESWPELLRDFRAGRLRKRYRQDETNGYAPHIPAPRYDLVKKSGYVVPYAVQATRGCLHHCDFCSVPGFHRRFTRRPIEDVVRDIRAVPSRRFVLNDVSPLDDREYAKDLLEAVIPLKKRWGGLATTQVNRDPELLELLRRSGCRYLLIGFESMDQKNLNGIDKGFNRSSDYQALMQDLHDAGIIVQGCFMFGFDGDDREVFARTVDAVERLRIDIPRYSFYTPYPGTPSYARLEAEGRILSRNWADYDTMHVVFRPKQMTPQELYEGFRRAYRKTFTMGRILRRTRRSPSQFPVTFAGNLIYRRFAGRLGEEQDFYPCGQGNAEGSRTAGI